MLPFDILYYFFIILYCAHCGIYNPYTTESWFLKTANQNQEKSVSGLLDMARPELMVFGLSLASSSSEFMNARIVPLE